MIHAQNQITHNFFHYQLLDKAVCGRNERSECLLLVKVSTYFQMLAEIIHDPPESDPFSSFLMFQVPFHVSLVAFSFQKFHSPLKKKITQTREPLYPLNHRSPTTDRLTNIKLITNTQTDPRCLHSC